MHVSANFISKIHQNPPKNLYISFPMIRYANMQNFKELYPQIHRNILNYQKFKYFKEENRQPSTLKFRYFMLNINENQKQVKNITISKPFSCKVKCAGRLDLLVFSFHWRQINCTLVFKLVIKKADR